MDSFVVDRGHPNGPEIHSVTDTGIIVVHNQRTGKMVTKLIARPGQVKRYNNAEGRVKRYYNAEGRNAPQNILAIAKEHLKKGYNNI